MKKCLLSLAFTACAATLLLVESASAAELKSGPQVGQRVPGPFHPLNCTGEAVGKKSCLVCKNGLNPVAMIFARENTPALVKLIKKIDQVTAKNKSAKMGSFVVFLGSEENLEAELKAVAKKNELQHCVLSIDNPAGPKGYNIARDADVTVVLYTQGQVKANHAFKKGVLDEKGIKTVLKDVSKILP